MEDIELASWKFCQFKTLFCNTMIKKMAYSREQISHEYELKNNSIYCGMFSFVLQIPLVWLIEEDFKI